MHKLATAFVRAVSTVATTLPGLPAAQAAQASSITAVTGHLLRGGRAVAGVDVLVTAWPKASVLAAQKIGDRVETRVVQRGKTSASGAFTVSIDPSALPALYRGPAGQVDLEIPVSIVLCSIPQGECPSPI